MLFLKCCAAVFWQKKTKFAVAAFQIDKMGQVVHNVNEKRVKFILFLAGHKFCWEIQHVLVSFMGYGKQFLGIQEVQTWPSAHLLTNPITL